jgi:hypothetical protein
MQSKRVVIAVQLYAEVPDDDDPAGDAAADTLAEALVSAANELARTKPALGIYADSASVEDYHEFSDDG